MARFVVQSVSRAGYAGSARLGRFWPAGQQTEIEILEQDDDPKPEEAAKAPVPTFGRKSLAKLSGDPLLKVLPAGDPMALAQASADLPALKSQIEALSAENRRLAEENRRLKGEPPAGEGGDAAKEDVTAVSGPKEGKSRK